MLDARSLIQACELLEEPGLSLAEMKLYRQALARQMRRVEKALARHMGCQAEPK
jgi:two-component system sensor histidine kinase EvgS